MSGTPAMNANDHAASVTASRAAPFVGDAVAKVGLHGGVEEIFAEDGEQDGNAECHEIRKECHRSHAQCEKENAGQHPKFSPAMVGNGTKDWGEHAEERTGGDNI
jgi:hypothetical protein